jgi:antitoxin (DNA-binding transcriptional repressor) of toxin-antitoxin stability system
VEVTIAELKRDLERYLSAAREGERVQVVGADGVVAELGPPEPTGKEKLDRLVAEGRARRGRGKLGPSHPQPAHYLASEIILEDRYSEQP